jgi:hypothetical protein
MKFIKKIFFHTGFILLFLVFAVLTAGCTSSSADPGSPVATPEITVSPQEVQEVQTPGVPVTPTSVPVKMVTLTHGMTISVPVDWEIKELSDTSLREYGRVTTNFANLFSPTMANGNYMTVSMDVDPETVTDSDRYFNLATVAVQKEYGTIEITHHTQTGSGQTLSACSGCKQYNLEFKTKTVQRWYHFVDVGGIFYVVTINNPNIDYDQVNEMLKSIKISNSVSTQKQR